MKITMASEGRTVAQALEKIHEDRHYIYFLPSMGSAQITVELDDGSRMGLKKALETGLATVDGLMAAGLKIIRNPK